MSNYIINRINADDSVFTSKAYLDDKLLFNYIEGAKKSENAEFLSDSKHVIICRKENNNSVWIWTDNDSYNNTDLVFEIAKAVSSFNIAKPQFFTKPNIAPVLSDMYALLSHDLDYHIKDEFSLGAYRYTGSDIKEIKDATIQQYNKKYSNILLEFYNELAEEFAWEDGRAYDMSRQCQELNTYLLLKNGEVMSLCVVSDNDGEYSSIRSVATKKAQRNKGYATCVTSFAASATLQKGKNIMVYTNKGNISAQSTLKKAGFSFVGDIHLIKS